MKKERETFDPGKKISKYTIVKLIGQGGFGDIYLAKDDTKKEYAIKTESKDAAKRALIREVEILQKLKNKNYFPQVYESGEFENYVYFVMDCYGPSLSSIRKNHFGVILSRYAYFLGIEMLKIIKELHEEGIVHCDIKPSNFLLKKNQDCPLTLIDFGLSKPYINEKTKEIIEPVNGHFSGTRKYSSIYVLQNQDAGRRDDLICWFYSVIELTKKLPWRNLHDNKEILESKLSVDVSSICNKLSKNSFVEIYNLINNLEFKDKPDYDKIYNILISDTYHYGYKYSSFDWISYYNSETELEEEEDDDNNDDNNNIENTNDKEQNTTNAEEAQDNEEQQQINNNSCCLIY